MEKLVEFFEICCFSFLHKTFDNWPEMLYWISIGTIWRSIDYFCYFIRQELSSQSTFMFRIIILSQSPSSTKLSSCIRNEMILKNLNVVRTIHNCFKGMIINETLDSDVSPYHHLLFVRLQYLDFVAIDEWYCETTFINKSSPISSIIFVLDCPLNTGMLLFLYEHWSSIGQSTLVTHSF